MRKNTALAKWRAGEQTIGGWLSLANTHTAEMMANAGFDWLCIDLQHGLLDYRDLLHMLPAISTTGVTPIVRVSGNDPKEIMKVLDAGAFGVISAAGQQPRRCPGRDLGLPLSAGGHRLLRPPARRALWGPWLRNGSQ